MKALLDTSVLVPVFVADHPHHRASLDLFLRFGKRQSCCAAQSLAELYSALTRMPGKQRISGEHAMLFLSQVREHLALVTLNEDEYYVAIEQASARGITGGTIYDVLLAACAQKVRAETIYTWNVRHFQQFDLGSLIKTP